MGLILVVVEVQRSVFCAGVKVGQNSVFNLYLYHTYVLIEFLWSVPVPAEGLSPAHRLQQTVVRALSLLRSLPLESV